MDVLQRPGSLEIAGVSSVCPPESPLLCFLWGYLCMSEVFMMVVRLCVRLCVAKQQPLC